MIVIKVDNSSRAIILITTKLKIVTVLIIIKEIIMCAAQSIAIIHNYI